MKKIIIPINGDLLDEDFKNEFFLEHDISDITSNEWDDDEDLLKIEYYPCYSDMIYDFTIREGEKILLGQTTMGNKEFIFEEATLFVERRNNEVVGYYFASESYNADFSEIDNYWIKDI